MKNLPSLLLLGSLLRGLLSGLLGNASYLLLVLHRIEDACPLLGTILFNQFFLDLLAFLSQWAHNSFTFTKSYSSRKSEKKAYY